MDVERYLPYFLSLDSMSSVMKDANTENIQSITEGNSVGACSSVKASK